MKKLLIIASLLICFGLAEAQAPAPKTISTTRLSASVYLNREWRRIMRAAEAIEVEARRAGVNLRDRNVYIRLSLERD